MKAYGQGRSAVRRRAFFLDSLSNRSYKPAETVAKRERKSEKYAGLATRLDVFRRGKRKKRKKKKREKEKEKREKDKRQQPKAKRTREKEKKARETRLGRKR